MMNELAISNATRDDFAAVGKIVVAWEQRTKWMHSAYSANEIAGFLDEAFDTHIILVAGRPARTYLAFNPEGQRIGRLYMQISGRGIGKPLMDKIKEGRDYLWLNTDEPNLAAQAFYKRKGFVEVFNEGAEPSNVVPELRMEWRR